MSMTSKRVWYKKAINSSQTIKTEPYVFSNIPTKGITYAQKLNSSEDVIAIDVLLYDVKALFKKFLRIIICMRIYLTKTT